MAESKAETPEHVDQLLKAVQNYVEKEGGRLVVIGGISLQQFQEDHDGVFHVAVKCLGKPPKGFKGRTLGGPEKKEVPEPREKPIRGVRAKP